MQMNDKSIDQNRRITEVTKYSMRREKNERKKNNLSGFQEAKNPLNNYFNTKEKLQAWSQKLWV